MPPGWFEDDHFFSSFILPQRHSQNSGGDFFTKKKTIHEAPLFFLTPFFCLAFKSSRIFVFNFSMKFSMDFIRNETEPTPRESAREKKWVKEKISACGI